MPLCPYCNQEITTLYSSLREDLVWRDGKWFVDIFDNDIIIACSACYEELGPKDLEKLGVSSELSR